MDDRALPLTFYRDGITRADALRRLLATTTLPARLWSPQLWIARLKAAGGLLWALWRERGR